MRLYQINLVPREYSEDLIHTIGVFSSKTLAVEGLSLYLQERLVFDFKKQPSLGLSYLKGKDTTVAREEVFKALQSVSSFEDMRRLFTSGSLYFLFLMRVVLDGHYAVVVPLELDELKEAGVCFARPGPRRLLAVHPPRNCKLF